MENNNNDLPEMSALGSKGVSISFSEYGMPFSARPIVKPGQENSTLTKFKEFNFLWTSN